MNNSCLHISFVLISYTLKHNHFKLLTRALFVGQRIVVHL